MYKPIDQKAIEGVILKNDKNPVALKVNVVSLEDGSEQSLMLTQDGDAKPEGGKDGGKGNENGGGNTQ